MNDEPTQGLPPNDGQDPAETELGLAQRPVTRVVRAAPPQPARQMIATAAVSAQRDRIGSLVAALGDPAHPLHAHAGEDLISIGEPTVGPLIDLLRQERPWLAHYRAVEVLGRLRAGRAFGTIAAQLRHPNTNVRWAAVRALSALDDIRALWFLRQAASDDQSRTSWGETVGGAAQSALAEMQASNWLVRGFDLAKTALAAFVMLWALQFARGTVDAARAEFATIGRPAETQPAEPLVRTVPPLLAGSGPAVAPLIAPTAVATSVTAPTAAPQSDAPAAPAPTSGQIVTTGNVRSAPVRQPETVIGGVSEGDQIIFYATTADRQWYRVGLGEQHAVSSRIPTPDGTGWVAQSLVTAPPDGLPIEEPPLPPTPTA